MTLHLAMFDFDGTLVDSHAGLHAAMAEAFTGLGLPAPSSDDVKGIIGLSGGPAMERLLGRRDEALARKLYRKFEAARAGQRARNDAGETFYPGAQECLTALAAAGVLIAIATNKSRAGLAHTLEQTGMAHHFVATRTADDGPPKPHPAMAEELLTVTGTQAQHAVMIGDTVTDMQLAANAGVPALGVAWGNQSAEHLTASGARHVVRSFGEVAPWLLDHWGLSAA